MDLSRRYSRFSGTWVTVHTKTGTSIAGLLREQTRTYLRLEPARQLIRGGRSILVDGGAVIPAVNLDWIQPHRDQPIAFITAAPPVVVGDRQAEDAEVAS